jgi:hypothetical protein
MRSSRLLAAAALLTAACTVDVPKPGDKVFRCSGPDDCIEGYECVFVNNESLGTCADRNGCADSRQCPTGAYCDASLHKCVATPGCSDDGPCTGLRMLCDTNIGACVNPCDPFPGPQCGGQGCSPNPTTRGFDCVPCNQGGVCGPGSVCVQDGTAAFCMQGCNGNQDCSNGNTCQSFNGQMVCRPSGGEICHNGADDDGDDFTDCGDSECFADAGCQASCGNGFADVNESCDDSGREAGDGCDQNCQIEIGWTCTDFPSVCAQDGSCIATNEGCNTGDICAYKGDTNRGICARACNGDADCGSGRKCVQMIRQDGGQQTLCGECPAGCPDASCQPYDATQASAYPGTTCLGCTPATCPGAAECGNVPDTSCGGIVLCGTSNGTCNGADACVESRSAAHSCERTSCTAQEGALESVPGFTSDGRSTASITACVMCPSAGCGPGQICQVVARGNYYEEYQAACGCAALANGPGWRALGTSACGGGVSAGLPAPLDPSLAITNDGRIYVAFTAQISGGRRRVYVRRFEPSTGGWVGFNGSDTGNGLSNGTAANDDAMSPRIEAGAGEVFVTWMESGGVAVVSRIDLTTETFNVYTSLTTPPPQGPVALAVSPGIGPMIAFHNSSDVWAWGPSGGSGSFNQLGDGSATQSPSFLPSSIRPPAVTHSQGLEDSQHRTIVAIQAGSGIFVRYADLNIGSLWQDMSPSNPPGIADQGGGSQPEITRAPDGQPVVAYNCCTAGSIGNIHIKKHNGGAGRSSFTDWGPVVGGASTMLNTPQGMWPSIAVDPGFAFVAYQTGNDTSTSQINLQMADSSGWRDLDGSNGSTGISNAENRATRPRVAVGLKPNNAPQVCVVWSNAAVGSGVPTDVYLRCHDL